MATVPMEKSGEVSAAYATDPSVRLKEGHSIAAMKKKKQKRIRNYLRSLKTNFIQKLFQFKSSVKLLDCCNGKKKGE